MVVVVADQTERWFARDERVTRFAVILEDGIALGVLVPEFALDVHDVPRRAQLTRRPKFISISLDIISDNRRYIDWIINFKHRFMERERERLAGSGR